MQLRYERFIGVRLRHDWYRDGVCRDLAIMPTTSTSIVLAAHRVRLLRCAGGVTLVGPTEPVPGGSPVALYPLAGGARLVFALCPTEPTFAVFTELPTDGGRSRWLLHNRKASWSLHAGEVVGADERVRLVGEHIIATAPRSAEGHEVTVTDGQEVVRASVRVTDLGHAGGEQVTLGLSLGDLRGEAWSNVPGRPAERLFVDPELQALGPLGILELRVPDAGWPCHRDLGTRRGPEYVEYTARFAARSVLWRYHIVLPRSAGDVGALSIDYPQRPPAPYPPGEAIAFNPVSVPEVAERFPGRSVASFESSRPLPLSQVALRNACLRASRVGPLVTHLPGPPCHSLARSGSSSAPFVSEIVVSL